MRVRLAYSICWNVWRRCAERGGYSSRDAGSLTALVAGAGDGWTPWKTCFEIPIRIRKKSDDRQIERWIRLREVRDLESRPTVGLGAWRVVSWLGAKAESPALSGGVDEAFYAASR